MPALRLTYSYTINDDQDDVNDNDSKNDKLIINRNSLSYF